MNSTIDNAAANNATVTTIAPAAGRVLLAAIFVISGLGKIAAPAATIGYIQSVGLPFATAGLLAAIAIEVGGGLALALGYRTRLVAALLAAFSIVAGLAFHNAIGDQNQFIHLLKNFAMAGGLLQVAAFGAGAFSIDSRLARLGRTVRGSRQPA
ncbi:DoxX family protein [Pseudoduganella buxea]|uniref:DoxX family membrane protein n=1 Tax=Pseudoduganella buxea TaxID=1949069 RepID=A0A6I3T101_9BURK|nr:DoxX family protein [Pseudoduganella buxea]MTV54595.1 DoxX family membrane protein [Pseudoduganella buxea]GGB93491.1 LysR family transcriptional regulator [Pseudoduganella buxea]